MSNEATAQAKGIEDFAEQNRLAQLPGAVQIADQPSIDIASLPEEVRKQLLGAENMEFDQLLMKILSPLGARLTVDKIILTLWVNYQKQMDRMKIIARLRSLVAEGYVHKEPEKRGIYSLTATGRDHLNSLTPKK